MRCSQPGNPPPETSASEHCQVCLPPPPNTVPHWRGRVRTKLTDVRPRSRGQVHARIFRRVEEGRVVEDALGSEVPGLAFQLCPVNIERGRVQAQRLDLMEHVNPQRRHRQTKGVVFSAVDHQPLSVDGERVVVPGDDILQQCPLSRIVFDHCVWSCSAEVESAAGLCQDGNEGTDGRERTHLDRAQPHLRSESTGGLDSGTPRRDTKHREGNAPTSYVHVILDYASPLLCNCPRDRFIRNGTGPTATLYKTGEQDACMLGPRGEGDKQPWGRSS